MDVCDSDAHGDQLQEMAKVGNNLIDEGVAAADDVHACAVYASTTAALAAVFKLVPLLVQETRLAFCFPCDGQALHRC